jgi:hypothetical protein
VNAIELFRTQINASHDIVENTVADCTPEMCDKPVEGRPILSARLTPTSSPAKTSS